MSDEGKIFPGADPVRYVQPVETTDRTPSIMINGEAPALADAAARPSKATGTDSLLRRILDSPEGPAQDVEDRRLLAWIGSLTRLIEDATEEPLLPRPRKSRHRRTPHRPKLSLNQLPDGARFLLLMKEVRQLYAALHARAPTGQLSKEEREALRRQIAQAQRLLQTRKQTEQRKADEPVVVVSDREGRSPVVNDLTRLAPEELEQELNRRLSGLAERWSALVGQALPLNLADLHKMVRLADTASRFDQALRPLELALQRMYRRAALTLKFMRLKIEAMARRDPQLRRHLKHVLAKLQDDGDADEDPDDDKDCGA